MWQLCQIPPTDFRPCNGLTFPRVQFCDSLSNLSFPSLLDALVYLATKVGNQRVGQRFLFFNGQRQRLLQQLTNFRCHLCHAHPARLILSQWTAEGGCRYANRNSLVRSSLIVSRSLAAFSNSKRFAASRMSLSNFPI